MGVGDASISQLHTPAQNHYTPFTNFQWVMGIKRHLKPFNIMKYTEISRVYVCVYIYISINM